MTRIVISLMRKQHSGRIFNISSVSGLMTLMKEEAPQREYPLRELFNGVRYMVRAGCPWRMIPHDLPPRHTVYEQSQRWIKAGNFESMAHDLRKVLRMFDGKDSRPTAVVFDGRTLG